jgi:3-hydroxyacyl-CoA dehydrogenase / enoyl-CoA hydratase / 3-hydroxybutyryl-CoA epimerase
MENFKTTLDADGVLHIEFNVPNKTMNTITQTVMAEMGALVEQIKTDDAIKGAVLFSGKDNGFCAGADLGEIGETSDIGDKPRTEDEKLKAAFDRGFSLCGLCVGRLGVGRWSGDSFGLPLPRGQRESKAGFGPT